MKRLFLMFAALCVIAVRAVASEVPYEPSSTPNVWVRSVPDPTPPMVPGPAQVAVLPGGTPPQATVLTPPPAIDYSRSFDLPGGGKMAFVPPQYFPCFTASIGPDGRLMVTCVEPPIDRPRLSLLPVGPPNGGQP